MSKPPSSCRYLIIGSGVTGISAAQAIRSVDSQSSITIISADPSGYYSRPGLAYYLTGEVSEEQLFPFTQADLRTLHIDWLTAEAVRILPMQHTVELADQTAVTYQKLLIATGSLASPLTFPGADLEGVFKLDHLADARAILRHCRHARTAVVTGGGITALELAEGLHAHGLQVHYLLRGNRYWSNVLDETESKIVETQLSQEGVKIHYRSEVAEITGNRGKVNGVRTKDGLVLPCNLIAFAIGVLPRKELAQAAGLNVDRGIVVDDFMRTSHPDIFAAGDVAQVYDPFSGKYVLDTLWNTARDQGHAAGLNMTGRPTRYQKSVAINITRLANLTTTIIGTVGQGLDPSLVGIARGDSETWRQLPIHTLAQTRDGIHRVRLLIGENRLLGAIIMGSQTLSLPLQDLISQQVDISAIRKDLLDTPDLNNTLIHFWENWKNGRINQRP